MIGLNLMKTINAVWKSTLMMVLVALSGALYAAILIPFKLLPIIPGVTEVRPANAIPIVCSLLFGPAGAWGSAIGNTVGDFAFGLGPGTLFGFVGNFLYGFAPYALWRTMFGETEPNPHKPSHWAALILVCAVASAACAFTIGWGIDVVITGVPFAILATIIFFNNFLMAVILAPPLLFALLPRVKAWGLLYTTVLPPEAAKRPRFAWLGAILFTVGSVGGLGAGEAIATGIYNQSVSVPWFLKQLKQVISPATAHGHPEGRAPYGLATEGGKVKNTKAAAASAPALGARSAQREGLTEGSSTPSVERVKAPAAPAAAHAKGKTPAGKVAAPPGGKAAPAKRSTALGLGLGLVPFLLLTFLGMLLL